MAKRLSAIILTSMLLINASCAQQSSAAKGPEDFAASRAAAVDKALDAYNREDCGQFYSDFSSQRFEKGERAFRAIWVEGYKRDFGKMVSKQLDTGFCDINAVYPMLVYRAKFEKNDYVTIKVIFVKEGEDYKIFYIRFDVLPPGTI